MTPAPYYADESVTLYEGDCLDVLRELGDASVDAVITDPPYGLGFMGHEWDQPGEYGALRGSGVRRPMHPRERDRGEDTTSATAGSYDLSQPANARFGAWCEAWARECLRVLKPGGHLLAFGGSRTWHRLAAAVEDAGFEIRDSIAWLYGSGFPKSLDVSKAIDKAAGAERQVVGTTSAGASSLQRVSRVEQGYRDNLTAVTPEQLDVTAPETDDAVRWQGWGTALKPAFEPIVVARKPLVGTVAANVLEHGTGALNIDACRIGRLENDGTEYGRGSTLPHANTTASLGNFAEVTPYAPHDAGRWPANAVLDQSQAAELDEQSGITKNHARQDGRVGQGKAQAPSAYSVGGGVRETIVPTDSGGASRFFYVAKAPTKERPRLEDGTAHPTVKPLTLMRWLVRLVTPAGGVVLDPFLGSGTTAEACLLEGFRCIGIERDPGYLRLAIARLGKPIAPVLFGEPA